MTRAEPFAWRGFWEATVRMRKPTIYDVGCSIAIITVLAGSVLDAQDSRAGADYFEREVRPIFADACFKCHGAAKQESDLRLDSRERMLSGGVSGAAIVPGQPERSI